MKIHLAESAGFCWGVRRAIEIAESVAEQQQGETVYTYGPLIHNPQELEHLRSRGIVPLDQTAQVPHAPVIVRAHGVTPEADGRIRRDASELVDATCPKVSKIQDRIRDFSARGYTVVIAGDPDHPEVEGLVGHAGGRALVVQVPEDVDRLPSLGKTVLVAQTTQDAENYARIRERFAARYPGAEALDTICSSTLRRQSELREMVRHVDAMVVIGGRNSANTRRLYEISRETGVPAYLVESAEELPVEELKQLRDVGVTAGASTPRWIIEGVVARLQTL